MSYMLWNLTLLGFISFFIFNLYFLQIIKFSKLTVRNHLTWNLSYLISFILEPPLPIIQPMRSLGMHISWVCGPVGIGGAPIRGIGIGAYPGAADTERRKGSVVVNDNRFDHSVYSAYAQHYANGVSEGYINVWKNECHLSINEPCREKTCLMQYVNKGTDQPAHPQRISTFVIHTTL